MSFRSGSRTVSATHDSSNQKLFSPILYKRAKAAEISTARNSVSHEQTLRKTLLYIFSCISKHYTTSAAFCLLLPAIISFRLILALLHKVFSPFATKSPHHTM